MIRFALPPDVPVIVGFIRELARCENAQDRVQITPEALNDALFGERPALFAHVAELDGEIVGFAIWFLNFSTWLGRHGIYIEDIYVRADRRGSGIGTALLRELASVAVERGYGRIEWWVLDWNKPAIRFYRSLGASAMDEWTVYRLIGDALNAAAAS